MRMSIFEIFQHLNNMQTRIFAVLYLAFFSCIITSCSAFSKEDMFHIYCGIPYNERVIKLKTIFIEWGKASDNEAQKKNEFLFFQYFPCSFTTFDSIYGYYPHDKHKGELRPFVDKHLELFFSLNMIPYEIKVKRIVDIAKEANWDDGMEFQYYLQQHIVINSSKYFKEIQKLTDEEIFNIWYYFFDGPHPENYNDLFKELYAKGYTLNKNIAELMQKAYFKLLSEKKCDGH